MPNASKHPIEQFSSIVTGISIAMILLGAAAIILPKAAGLIISVTIGWLILLAGVAHLAHALIPNALGSILWRSLLGVLYVIGGFYLILNPGLSLVTLTLLLAVLLLLEGLTELFFYFFMLPLRGSAWLLVDALSTFILGALIWRGWPSTSAWAIGILIGINLVFSGTMRLLFTTAERRAFVAAA
jgi:uncharacterized membrane protein HdeD (DUF308 family)